MLLSKPILAENKLRIRPMKPEHLLRVFDNLKADDLREINEDAEASGVSVGYIRKCIGERSAFAYTAKLNHEIMFCAGLYNLDTASIDGQYVMWWIPTTLCEEKKVSYVKLAIKMRDILQANAGGKDIYTYTPTWYKKNFHATKDLGFKFLGKCICPANGHEVLLSVLEGK